MNTTSIPQVCVARLLEVTEQEFGAYDGRLAVHVPDGVSPFTLRTSPIGRHFIHQDNTWYDSHPWARECLPAGNYDVRLPIPGSNRKTFAEQQELLLPGEEPIPLVLAQLSLLYCHTRGLSDPLQDGWVRCRETAAGGYRVVLTWYDGRLSVVSYWGGLRNGSVWLGAGTSAT